MSMRSEFVSALDVGAHSKWCHTRGGYSRSIVLSVGSLSLASLATVNDSNEGVMGRLDCIKPRVWLGFDY